MYFSDDNNRGDQPVYPTIGFHPTPRPIIPLTEDYEDDRLELLQPEARIGKTNSSTSSAIILHFNILCTWTRAIAEDHTWKKVFLQFELGAIWTFNMHSMNYSLYLNKTLVILSYNCLLILTMVYKFLLKQCFFMSNIVLI